MTRPEAEILLKQKFRLERFYDTQWDVIQKIFKGEKVLLIEKTGYGKSLCFQFPATFFEGTTVVFSPLIALMRDQVKKLDSLGHSEKNSAMKNLTCWFMCPRQNQKILSEILLKNFQ